jgi:hypothetical protein
VVEELSKRELAENARVKVRVLQDVPVKDLDANKIFFRLKAQVFTTSPLACQQIKFDANGTFY